MSCTICHLHASGRFDIRENLLASDLGKWIELVDPSVITLTEAGDGGRGKALTRPGWHRVQGRPGIGSDECALGFRDDTWRLVAMASVPVSPMTYARLNGKQSPRFFALLVVLEHLASGELVLFSVLHTPSHVETPNGWRAGDRQTVYRSVLRGWRKQARAFASKHGAKSRVLTADLNLNVRKGWVRSFFTSQFPHATMTWDKIRTGGGTLGGRLIDSSILSRRVKALGARVMPKGPSSDHRAFVERLEIG